MKHATFVHVPVLSVALMAICLSAVNSASAQTYQFSTLENLNGVPCAGVIQSADGSTLYGTEEYGGPNADGSVFAVSISAGTINTLASFNGTNGQCPMAGLVLSPDGSTLYGTASEGGANGDGTVFSVPVIGGNITTLATFGKPTGTYPEAVLTLSPDGKTLYGTTMHGGDFTLSSGWGDGTVFSVPAAGGTVTTLATFEGTNGANPQAGVILSADGSTLYGTTYNGGANGDGTVYSVPITGGSITTLAAFDGTDGMNPYAGVTLSHDGTTLYGTTFGGGANGEGTVYSVPVTGGSLTDVVAFDSTNGARPEGGVIFSPDGNTFYGTTYFGGNSANPYGTVFSVPVTGGSITTLAAFTGSNGSYPCSAVLISTDENTLFGTTLYGGTHENGTIFALTSNATPTTTTLDSSPNSSSYGAPVTFTATITPSVPTGETVRFCAGTKLLGSGTTAGSGAQSIASYTTIASQLAAGSNSITALYVGDTNYQSSRSSALTQVVTALATSTTLVSSSNPSVYGSPVTYTATVAPAVPDGETVTFSFAGSPIGTGTTSGSKASFTTTATQLPAGSNFISAAYAGDANYQTSSSAQLTQVVNPASTTTTLTSSLNPSAYGTSVTITATIHPVVPSGETVTFYNGKTQIGTGAVNGTSATFSTSQLPAGSNSIKATYTGDANYLTSPSNLLTQTVTTSTKIATVTSVASSLNPSACLSPVTLTATMKPIVPEGEKVTFYSGKTVLGTGATAGSVATLTTSSLLAGSDSITATYAGDTNYVASTSKPLTQTVNKIATATALISSLTPSVYGNAVTFTATVNQSVPNGEIVMFYCGSSSLGSAKTTNAAATFTAPKLAPSSYTITASYPGDANYLSSKSNALTQTVNKVTTSTALKSSASSSTYGQPVTFTATVSPTVPNNETVTFYNGTKSLGTAKTTNSAASMKISSFAAGSYSITATYAGDSDNSSSTSSALPQTVNQASTATVLKSSLNPSKAGQSVTFTATISPSVPNGETVTFYNGTTVLGTSKTSGSTTIFTTSALASGGNSITATYAGDTNYAGSKSIAITQKVN